MSHTSCLWRSLVLVLLVSGSSAAAQYKQTRITVFDQEELFWDQSQPEVQEPDGYVVRFARQSVVRTIDLPPRPEHQRAAQRIMARIDIEPLYESYPQGRVAHDPWTRLGSLTVESKGTVVEIMRFITPFGGRKSYEQDVTPLAPYLAGPTKLRLYIATYGDAPGWLVSLQLRYSAQGVGQRRPFFAKSLWYDLHMTDEDSAKSVEVVVPEGVEQSRLRVMSTGHSTDGRAGNEFLPCPHVLRMDGIEIARWRPFLEGNGYLRRLNPASGQMLVDERVIRSSDLDRSGWRPAEAVTALIIPLPELQPGPHRFELEIHGIRPKDPPNEIGKQHHGYWAVSVTLIADEAWPEPPVELPNKANP